MFEALVLGIVQGLTEFLPVSSTAHLILFPWFLKWGGLVDTLTFDIALHAGTLAALLACFWKEWVDILFKKQRLLWLIMIASLPAGLFGVLFNDLVEKTLRSPLIISLSLVAIGLLMLASEKAARRRAQMKLDHIALSDALVIGLSQAVALIPGVSRSGVTISSGLFQGLGREDAAKFSFLLSTPIIAGAVMLHGRKLIGHPDYDLSLFGYGFAASAITGFVAIKFLLHYFKTHPINIFSYYRFLLAAVIIAGIWLKG